jgi:hypothetical protein
MTRHHLTDTELLGLHFDRRRDGEAHDHVAACATCQARGRAVAELLDEATRATASETDALFGPDAVARQHTRIMSRVANECRSARIISFPTAPAAPTHPPRTGMRWVAAAVAAGVILGIVGEHVTHRITRTPYPSRAFEGPSVQMVAQPVRGATVRTVSTGSDDEFYGQVELAFGSAGPAALRSLDALTPRVSDVSDVRE